MRRFHLISFLLIAFTSLFQACTPDNVHFTSGFKLGELTDSSVVIWTRLCEAPEMVPVWHERGEAPFKSPLEFDNKMNVVLMDGAVEGASGQVKVILSSGLSRIATDWADVSAEEDYTFKHDFLGLKAGTTYKVRIKGRKDARASVTKILSEFSTAPSKNDIVPVCFTSTSCQYFWDYDDSIRGFKTYDSMLELDPDFHCQTGDFVYYDKPGPMSYSVELARHKWHAMNAWPSLVDFYSRVPVYLQKDDHDMLRDDASPGIASLGAFSFNDGLKIWREQVPVIGLPYRTMRWGKDLQIWMVEGREFRSENQEPDGPSKSIWGEVQKSWFMETVSSSDASFKILLSPTPVVGPDRSTGKNDNHSNLAYQTEGIWLREFLGKNNVYVINGDRHWQYVSVDSVSGTTEFSQGPTSDSHAQGWKQEDFRPQHRFLRVKGGFLAVRVHREDVPLISFIHYDVEGNEVHRETFRKV